MTKATQQRLDAVVQYANPAFCWLVVPAIDRGHRGEHDPGGEHR